MARYFIALLPPQVVQDAASQIQRHFAERYTSRKAQNSPPHITLQPPFEWSVEEGLTLEQCLSDFACSQRSIPVGLSGFAAFPPRVIYINVLKTPELIALQIELAVYLESRLGIVDPASKSRAFKPHLTVAFRDLTRANFRAAWAEFQHQPFEFQFTVPALTLLAHNGRRWNAIADFSFLPATSNTPAKIEN
jgi:2'-5' RNA ligase